MDQEASAIVKTIISRLEDIGMIREKLHDILDEDIFDSTFLYRKNKYWDSKHPEEFEKLDNIRRNLINISDKLWYIYSIINKLDEYGQKD